MDRRHRYRSLAPPVEHLEPGGGRLRRGGRKCECRAAVGSILAALVFTIFSRSSRRMKASLLWGRPSFGRLPGGSIGQRSQLVFGAPADWHRSAAASYRLACIRHEDLPAPRSFSSRLIFVKCGERMDGSRLRPREAQRAKTVARQLARWIWWTFRANSEMGGRFERRRRHVSQLQSSASFSYRVPL